MQFTDTDTAREDFEHWLANIDNYLSDFFASLPKDIADKLDFSPQSMNILEQHLLDRFASIDEAKQPENAAALNGYSIYCGESFRKFFGGKWQIQFDDPNDAYYGIPVMRSDNGPTLAALLIITSTIARRRGDNLSKLYERNLSYMQEKHK